MGNETNNSNDTIEGSNQLESLGNIGNIKSKHILKIILNHFQKKKILQLVKKFKED